MRVSLFLAVSWLYNSGASFHAVHFMISGRESSEKGEEEEHEGNFIERRGPYLAGAVGLFVEGRRRACALFGCAGRFSREEARHVCEGIATYGMATAGTCPDRAMGYS